MIVNFYKGTEIVYSCYANELEDVLIAPKKFYSECTEDMYITDKRFENPIIVDGRLREATRNELVEQGKEVKLNIGEIIEEKKIIVIEKPKNLISPIWNFKAKKWEENYTKEQYLKDIDKVKAQVLTNGYEWNGHQQKCRDKDVAFLESVISTQKDYKADFGKDLIVEWAFNDNDRDIPMTLKETKALKYTGQAFMQKVFKVEGILKKQEPQEITFEKFIEMIKG